MLKGGEGGLPILGFGGCQSAMTSFLVIESLGIPLEKGLINSEFLDKINEKYKKLKEHEVRYESINIENADLIIVAYGTVARIVKTVIQKAKKEGINIGLIRPITLFPFPEKIISKTAERIKKFLVVEMSLGQMIEDVKLAVNGKAEVNFYGRCGGIIPTPIEILKELNKYL